MSESPAVPGQSIRTSRLDLHVVRPTDYELLVVDRADARLWTDRGLTNPYGYLVEDAGPLPYRLPQVRENPAAAPFLMRVAALRDTGVIVGGAGFHGLPDADGMIEIGYTVVPECRRQGFGVEILHGMWGWVVREPGVRILRYSVGVDNAVSQHVVRALGFEHVGVQDDDEDGPEDVFELSAAEYLRRFCG